MFTIGFPFSQIFKLKLRSVIARLVTSSFLFLTWTAPGHAETILVFGDSLSAGYGLRAGEGWVELLSQKLNASTKPYRVVNASISGDTTRGGLARLSHALATHKPDIVIVELGANDGLRGLPLADMHKNLEKIITQCKNRPARVVLVGMKLPPNYGPDYTNGFEKVFKTLARTHNVPLVPFLLAGLENDKSAFQADQLHPVAAAEPKVLENVWGVLKGVL